MCKCQHLARIKWIEPLSQRNWKYTGREGRGAEPRCVSCRDHVSATVHCATRMIGAGWQTPVIVMAVEALMICCCEASMTLMVVVNSDGRDDGGGGDECVCFLMTRFAQAHHGAAGVRRHRVRRHRVRRHSAAGGGRRGGNILCHEGPKTQRGMGGRWPRDVPRGSEGAATRHKKRKTRWHHHRRKPLAYRQPRGAQTARRVAEAILCQARLVLISSEML